MTTANPNGFNNYFTLEYDPTLHSGSGQVGLPPNATLTYVIPFTTPTHLNRCLPTTATSNSVTATYTNASGGSASSSSTVNQNIGMPPCVPGTLGIQKNVLLPAVAGNSGTIPPTGLISYDVTLTNLSTTAILDIPHFVDTPQASGTGSVTISVVSIVCTTVSGGAQCPTNPVVAGIRTPASGAPALLPNSFDIDHEWGSAGNNTFPPQSSVKFTITVQLSNPTRNFYAIGNAATFSGDNDPKGWLQASDFVFIQPPPAPELSLQKSVSTQIAGPNTLVTYTVVVTNIGAAAANSAVLSDALPAALLGSNPGGFSNATCTDVSGAGFIPPPTGAPTCPAITSNASGLLATIANFPANSALRFTYQALMPTATVSIDNLASVTAPTASGALSFGSGTAQSQQNVQVISAAGPGPQPAPTPLPVPMDGRWPFVLFGLLLAVFGGLRLGMSSRR